VAARQEFGRGVHAVIEQRFVQAIEGRAGIGSAVLDAQGLDAIDHVIGAGVLHDPVGRAAGRIAGIGGERGAFGLAPPLRPAPAGPCACCCCASISGGLATRAAAPAAALFRPVVKNPRRPTALFFDIETSRSPTVYIRRTACGALFVPRNSRECVGLKIEPSRGRTCRPGAQLRGLGVTVKVKACANS